MIAYLHVLTFNFLSFYSLYFRSW